MTTESISSAEASPSVKKQLLVTKLRYFLDERGIRLTWLSKKTGIEYNRLCRLSAGTNEPTIREGFLIRRALLCELSEIFDTEVSLPTQEQGGD